MANSKITKKTTKSNPSKGLRRRMPTAQPQVKGKNPQVGPLFASGNSLVRRIHQRQDLFKEISLSDPTSSILGTLFPYNPDELVGKRGLEIFDKMRKDDQIHAALSVKKMSVLASGWSVIPPVGPFKVRDMDERVNFIRSQLRNVGAEDKTAGSNFEYDLMEIMTAFDYGFSITEMVYRVIPPEQPFAGKIGLKALKTRKPHSFDFVRDQHGNLLKDGIQQTTPGGMTRMSPGKFILYTYSPEFDNPYGRSDLISVYREWFSKDTVHKFWTIALERYGEPLADLEYDETVGPEDQNILQDILSNLSSRNYFLHPKGSILSIKEPMLRGVNAYRDATTTWNLGIARGILIPKHLGLTEGGEVGTLAQAKENMRVFLMIVQSLRTELAQRVVQRQIIRPLMQLNFNPPEPEPEFQFNPLTDEQAVELAETFLLAVEKGVVKPGYGDEVHVRRLSHFPVSSEDAKEDEQSITVDPSVNGKPAVSVEDAQDEEQPDTTETKEMVRAFLRTDQPDPHHHDYQSRKFDLLRPPNGEVENRFGFRTVVKELNEIADAADEALVTQMTKLKDTAKTLVGRMYKPFPKPSNIRKFTFPATTFDRVRKEVEAFILDGFEKGRAQARKVIKRARKNYATNPLLLTPETALRVFKERAFWVTGVLSDDLTNGVKAVLTNALLTGATLQETMVQIARLFDQYAQTPELAASISDDARTAPRIETVVRTNLMTAYNQGALVEYRRAAQDGLVEAVEFSAIIDDRTTQVCLHMDGKIIPINHPQLGSFTPPLHFQCRSILVPLLVGDEWKSSSASQLNRGLELADSRFIAA